MKRFDWNVIALVGGNSRGIQMWVANEDELAILTPFFLNLSWPVGRRINCTDADAYRIQKKKKKNGQAKVGRTLRVRMERYVPVTFLRLAMFWTFFIAPCKFYFFWCRLLLPENSLTQILSRTLFFIPYGCGYERSDEHRPISDLAFFFWGGGMQHFIAISRR